MMISLLEELSFSAVLRAFTVDAPRESNQHYVQTALQNLRKNEGKRPYLT